MVGGGGVQGRYGEVSIRMRRMARLRRVAAWSWVGVSCARVSWARMLFSARVDGIGPFSSSAEFFGVDSASAVTYYLLLATHYILRKTQTDTNQAY